MLNLAKQVPCQKKKPCVCRAFSYIFTEGVPWGGRSGVDPERVLEEVWSFSLALPSLEEPASALGLGDEFLDDGF